MARFARASRATSALAARDQLWWVLVARDFGAGAASAPLAAPASRAAAGSLGVSADGTYRGTYRVLAARRDQRLHGGGRQMFRVPFPLNPMTPWLPPVPPPPILSR